MTEREAEFERAAAQIFGSPHGRFVLDYLDDLRRDSLFDSDPLKMARKVGQYELLNYLRSFVRTE